MPRFRKKPIVIEATQWFKNGDHPDDYAADAEVFENGLMKVAPGAVRKARGWEASVVRFFRHPHVAGGHLCRHCLTTMHNHGWIDTPEGGHIVCPGDWIITGVKGERYPCKPDVFAMTHEPVETTQ